LSQELHHLGILDGVIQREAALHRRGGKQSDKSRKQKAQKHKRRKKKEIESEGFDQSRTFLHGLLTSALNSSNNSVTLSLQLDSTQAVSGV
jgi:hypothetical protein